MNTAYANGTMKTYIEKLLPDKFARIRFFYSI